MVERYIHRGRSERLGEEGRRLIGSLFMAKGAVLKEAIAKAVSLSGEGRVKFLVKPNLGLDVAFWRDQGDGGPGLIRVDLGGECLRPYFEENGFSRLEDCVGLVVLEEGEEMPEIQLPAALLGESGEYSVLGLTMRELKMLEERVGRVLSGGAMVEQECGGESVNGKLGFMQHWLEDLDGMLAGREITRGAHRRAVFLLNALAVQARELAGMGLDLDKLRLEEVKGGGVAVFFNASGVEGEQSVGVPMRQVYSYKRKRDGKIKRGETTLADRVVFGVYVPPTKEGIGKSVWRLQRLASTRLAELGDPIRASTEVVRDVGAGPEQILMAVADKKQVDRWRQMGDFFAEVGTVIEGAVRLDEVMGVVEPLVVGKCVLRVGSQQPPGVDVVFWLNDPSVTEARRYQRFAVKTLDGKGRVQTVKNTAALLCCPDEWTHEQMREEARVRANQLRSVGGGAKLRVVTVNSAVLELWREMAAAGEMVFEVQELANKVDDYEWVPTNGSAELCRGRIDGIDLAVFVDKPRVVGAVFTQIIVRLSDGEERCITIDPGTRFGPEYRQSRDATIEDGVLPFANVVARRPNLIRTAVILKTLEHQGRAFVREENEFWLRELALRLGEDGMAAALKEVGVGKRQVEQAMRMVQGYEDMALIKQVMAQLTHWHADHSGLLPVLASYITQVMAGNTWPMALRHYMVNTGFSRQATIRRPIQTVIGERGRGRFGVPTKLLDPRQVGVFEGGMVEVEAFRATHSTPTAMLLTRVYETTKGESSKQRVISVLSTGDFRVSNWRDGREGLTEKSFGELARRREPVEVAVVDCTNFLLERSLTPSAVVTEDMVCEALDASLRLVQGLPIVFAADNDPIRNRLILESIARIAPDRMMVVGMRLGSFFQLQQEVDQLFSMSKHPYPYWHDEPRIHLGESPVNNGVVVGLFRHHKDESRLSVMERKLKALYGGYMVQPDDLSLHPERYVLVLPPHERLAKRLVHTHFDQGGRLIFSTSWPRGYIQSSVRENFWFARDRGLEVRADFEWWKGRFRRVDWPSLHYSGHAREDEVMRLIEQLRECNGLRVVVLQHGPDLDYAKAKIRRRFPDLQVVVMTDYKANEDGMRRVNLVEMVGG